MAKRNMLKFSAASDNIRIIKEQAAILAHNFPDNGLIEENIKFLGQMMEEVLQEVTDICCPVDSTPEADEDYMENSAEEAPTLNDSQATS